MKMSGWLRLWIVVSVLYLVLVVGFVTLTLPHAGVIPHSSLLYDQISPEVRAKILGTKGADADPERQALLEEARRRGIITEVEMPNKHILVFKSDIPRNEQESAAKAYWTVVEKVAGKERQKHISMAFLWWIIPVVVIYVLGWAVAWVYRGFKHQ